MIAGKAYRILIVDDDREFNTLLADVYKQARYQVVSASNAQQGLELFSMQSFDLVVTDHLMPDRTGLEFAKKAHAMKDFTKCLLIIGGRGGDYLSLASDFDGHWGRQSFAGTFESTA